MSEGDLRPSAVVISGFIFIGMALVAVGLHAAAFYGLRRKARWGWLAAVVVARFLHPKIPADAVVVPHEMSPG